MSYRPSRGTSAPNDGHATTAPLLEQQNDELVEGLSNKVSSLKRIAIAIGDDVREQNKLLNEMDSSFDSARGILGATMKKLGVVSRAGGKNVLIYLVLFAVLVFFIIYYCIR